MQILVLSDSHGSQENVLKAVRREKGAEVVIHLGDGADDILSLRVQFADKMFLQVKGNNDFGMTYPVSDCRTFGGKSIFFTHGHYFQVKYDPYQVTMAVRERGADICLFGHTHVPLNDYANGIYIMNPGSIGDARHRKPTYGMIEILDEKIHTRMEYL